MGFLKEAEIGVRRFLVLFLGLFVNRSRHFDISLDFNSCKFLLVRQDRIGDVLVSTPLIAGLNQAYPSAAVDILLSRNNYSVLDNEPSIRKRWLYEKNPLSILRLIRQLRRERYDVIIDLMDNPSATSTLFLALAGGTWNVGLDKDNSYVYDVRVPLRSRKDVHIVERLAELLRPLRVNLDSSEMHIRYNVAPNSRAFAGQFWKSQGLEEKKIVGINISSGSKARFWGVHNFQELIRLLKKDYPEWPVLILYHPRDKHHAQEIVGVSSNVLMSPPTDSFDQFAAVIQRLSILITPDTSAVHLAAAFQVPSVVLYVQSNKELRIWDPYNSPSESLITDVDDLTKIAVDDVYAALQRLLNVRKSVTIPSTEQKAARP